MSGWVAGAVVVSGLIGGSAAESAAETQAGAATAASEAQVAEQRRQFDVTTEQYRPYREAGERALGRLEQFMTPGQQMQYLEQMPGYQFRLKQGQRAMERSAAAGGGLVSGKTLKGLMEFGQGVAGQTYGEEYNRLAGLAGTGQTMTSNLGSLGMQTAQNIGQARASGYLGAGQAQAAGTVGMANAMTGAIGQGYNAYMMNQYFGRPQAAAPAAQPSYWQQQNYGSNMPFINQTGADAGYFG